MAEYATSERRRIVSRAVLIMALAGMAAVGVTIPMLYGAAYDAARQRLADVVATRVALIQAIHRFDSELRTAPDGRPDPDAATLTQLAEAHRRFEGFGATGELVLGRRAGDQIEFLIDLRHQESELPRPVAWSSQDAEPMRRALEGLSGTARLRDYRGVEVLASYGYVPETSWGVVAKLDLAEVRAPFLRAGALAVGIGLVFVLLGSAGVQRLVSPLLRAIDKRATARVEAEAHDREAAEEITRDSLSVTQSVLDTAVDAIITIDPEGGIHSVNRAALAMFGYEAHELVGQNVRMLMPDPYRAEHDGYLRNYRETGQRKIIGIGREVPCRRKDGSVFPGDLAVSEVVLHDRTLYTGIMRDLTERKRSEEKLAEAEQRARAAEELASVGTLVAGLAHEIGTPMGVIQGHAKLLEKHVQDERAQWRLQTIQEQIGRISKIIQSLLNMARPKATERIPVALEPLLENTLSFLAEKLRRRGVEVVREFHPTGSVTGDPERLQQLLLNLFLNAVDAMPEGGELRVGLRPDGLAGAILEVSDTGTGIEPGNLDRIFDAFYTSKEAGKGNGLGLMVASRIVADHGGTIEVESSIGRGTRFQIHLPWKPSYREAPPEPGSGGTPRVRSPRGPRGPGSA
jgi:two-component system sensor kinase FixL